MHDIKKLQANEDKNQLGLIANMQSGYDLIELCDIAKNIGELRRPFRTLVCFSFTLG